MKKFVAFPLFILFIFPLVSLAQGELVDEGFSPISINASTEDLSENLIETEASELWFDNEEDENSPYRYVCDLKSLKSKDYFGLAVERIEIKTTWCYTGESTEDDDFSEYPCVQEFNLFIPLPSEKEFKKFSANIEDKYGPIRAFEINEEDNSETPIWFSDLTLLTFTNFDAPFVKDGKKYILVKYSSGHGG